MQGLLERFEKMAEYPLGHMSSLFASVLIGEPEMDSVQDTHENNIVPSIRENGCQFLQIFRVERLASDLRSVHLRFLNA